MDTECPPAGALSPSVSKNNLVAISRAFKKALTPDALIVHIRLYLKERFINVNKSYSVRCLLQRKF